jgi:hypothetical protein
LGPSARPPEYDIRLALAPPVAVIGRMFIDSGARLDLSRSEISLLAVDPDLPSPAKVLGTSDGQFQLKGVLAGSYVLDVSSLPEDLYLKAARFGSADVLEKPLTIQPSEPAGLFRFCWAPTAVA